ncbi:MAG: chromate transporter [Fervidobacterium sp.]
MTTLERRQISLLELFLSTMKIGALTIGGGYAMVPIIKDEFVKKKGLLSEDEFTTLLVIAQSLPGPIAVNTSTLVGYKVKKLPGALSAVSGAIFVPTVSIIIIAVLLTQFYNYIQPFLKGMKASLFAILLVAVIKMWKANVKNIEDFVIFLVSFSLLIFLKFNPVTLVFLGIIYAIIKNLIHDEIK